MVQKARHTHKTRKSHKAQTAHEASKAHETHEARKLKKGSVTYRAHRGNALHNAHKAHSADKPHAANEATRSSQQNAKQLTSPQGVGGALAHLPQCTVYDLAIIGGGASGLAAAIMAAQQAHCQRRPLRIVVLEQSKRIGASIMRSGNGRCNFSHRGVEADCYHNASFVQHVFEEFEANDALPSVLSWFDNLGLVYSELAGSDGMLFPLSRKANSVLDVLRRALEEYHIEACTNTAVVDLRRGGAQAADASDQLGARQSGTCGNKQDGTNGRDQADAGQQGDEGAPASPPFVLSLQSKEPGAAPGGSPKQNNAPKKAGSGGHVAIDAATSCTIEAHAVILAAGGGCAQSVTSSLREALPLVPCTPVLGPLALHIAPELAWPRLNGIRMAARVTLPSRGFSEEGEVLFRGYGISGIVVFNASRFACPGDTLLLDLMPSFKESDLVEVLQQRAERFATRDALALFEGFLLPAVAETIVRAAGASVHEPLSLEGAKQVAHTLKSFPAEVEGLADPRSAQVQRGGCAVEAFNPATLEARKVPGLYVTGEALDVDGPCGGYNLHWAWTSGLVAGYDAARSSKEVHEP